MTSAGRGGGGLPTVPRTGCPSLTLGQVRAIIELHQGVFFISGASGQSLILARTGEPGADNPRFLFVPCIRRAGRLHSHTIGTDPVLIEKWRSFRDGILGCERRRRATALGTTQQPWPPLRAPYTPGLAGLVGGWDARAAKGEQKGKEKAQRKYVRAAVLSIRNIWAAELFLRRGCRMGPAASTRRGWGVKHFRVRAAAPGDPRTENA